MNVLGNGDGRNKSLKLGASISSSPGASNHIIDVSEPINRSVENPLFLSECRGLVLKSTESEMTVCGSM